MDTTRRIATLEKKIAKLEKAAVKFEEHRQATMKPQQETENHEARNGR